MCTDAVGVLALPQLCGGHAVGVLPCSTLLSAEPVEAPCRRGGPSSGQHVGLRERSSWRVKDS